jgi:two-component system response regulator HydG
LVRLVQASDFNIQDLLEFVPQLGLVLLRDRRVVIMEGDILGELRRMILESVGWERCKPIVFEFGYHAGLKDAQSLGQMYNWNNREEWFRSGLVMQTQRGQGRAQLTRFELSPDNSSLRMEGRWYNSYEVDSHERLKLTTTGPVCYVLSGYLSGFGTVCFGKQVLVMERQCSMQGKRFCTFEGRFLEEWGDIGQKAMEEYRVHDLGEKLETLRRTLDVYRSRSLPMEVKSGERPDDKKKNPPDWVVCRSRAMEQVMDLARRVAESRAIVLLTGETGVGKEIIARYIHYVSRGGSFPYLAINCTTLPDPLLESELFGHVKGAFTGAHRNNRGLFLEAGAGTIFLDEIGDLAPSLQMKLLRVLEDRKVRPVGGSKETPVKARVIASTNKDLDRLIEEKAFRSDLYYRINVFQIRIPSLQERRDDILPLARFFLRKHCPKCPGFSPNVVDVLESYPWPGNVRELEHAIEHATILAGKEKIQLVHLPPALNPQRLASVRETIEGWPSLEELERRYIQQVLQRFGGKKAQAARALGIASNTLWRKLKGLEG